MTKKRKNYVEPADFFDEVLRCRRNGKASDELGKIFLTLADRFCNHPNFVRYKHIREDLISAGVMTCLKAFDKFQPYNKLGTLLIMGDVVEEDGVYYYTINGKEYSFRFPDIAEHSQHLSDIYGFHKENGDLYKWQGEDLVYAYKTCYNPHALFTKVLSNAYKQLLKNEYKQKNVFNKVCIENGLDPDYGYVDMIKRQEDDIEDDDIVEQTNEQYDGKIEWG